MKKVQVSTAGTRSEITKIRKTLNVMKAEIEQASLDNKKLRGLVTVNQLKK